MLSKAGCRALKNTVGPFPYSALSTSSLTAPARTRTQNPTFEASCDVQFHYKGVVRSSALPALSRPAGAARGAGFSVGVSRRHRCNKQKTPGPFTGPRGSFFSRKRANPGHPVEARRSSLRSERLRRDRRSVRDSRASKRAHAPPPVRRSVPSSEASCRDRMNMGSTLKTAFNKRVLQYVSACGLKSISFFKQLWK